MLSVDAWQKYLAVMGKLPTFCKVEKNELQPEHGDERDESFAIAFLILFRRLSRCMVTALHHSLNAAGVKITPRRSDLTAFYLWMQLAATYSKLAEEYGVPGPFEPYDDGGPEYPDEIVKLAARVTKTLPKENPVSPVAPPAEDQPATESPGD